MSQDKKINRAEFNQRNPGGDALDSLEIAPCAIVLWSSDRSRCLLNESAAQLIRFSENDFFNRPFLWVERIHRDDRDIFARSQAMLCRGESPVQCDYRFFPRDVCRPIWIREKTALAGGQIKATWDIISVYTEISDIKSPNAPRVKVDDRGDLLKPFIHHLQNCIQKVEWELGLLQIDQKENFKAADVVSAMSTINRSLRDLREDVVRLVERRAFQDPLAILDSIIRKIRNDLTRKHVNLRLVRREPLPMVKVDKDQLQRAFEQVFEFCGAMLKDGGNLEVEAGPTEIGGQFYAEVKVTSSSSVPIDLGEEGTFQPHLGIEDRRIGLGIVLASEILRRYRGQVSFRKESDNSGQVTVLIEASPN